MQEIKIGDKVVVHETCRHLSGWTTDMDHYVNDGNIYTVDFVGSCGEYIGLLNHGIFHASSLKIVNPKFKVGDVVKIVNEDLAYVSCCDTDLCGLTSIIDSVKNYGEGTYYYLEDNPYGWPEGCLESYPYTTKISDSADSHAVIQETIIPVIPDTEKQLDQWDESLRGKKMSNNTGKVIYKYQMPVKEQFSMRLPKGAEIIRVADQDGMFWMWCIVDTRVEDETRNFVAVKCGGNVPEDKTLKYIGMCAIFVQQELALYIFEDVTE